MNYRPATALSSLLLTFLFFLNGSILGQNTVQVSGFVTNLAGKTITDVRVHIYGTLFDGTPYADSTTTTFNFYSFNVPVGGSYTVAPQKGDDPLNGVSTFDIFLLQKHYLGTAPFVNPYQIIAADANMDNSADIGDSLALRNIILLIDDNFPNQKSWRFVPANYVFPDPLNPFPFPESVTLPNLTTSVSQLNFLGIKIGDINYSAVGSGAPWLGAGINGSIKLDDNADCITGPNALPAGGWSVLIENSSKQYLTKSEPDGSFFASVEPGAYTVSLLPPNGLWEACPSTSATVSQGEFATAQLSAKPVEYCPFMTVDLSTPFLRRCFSNYYRVEYSNQGTVAATDVKIGIQPDSFLVYEGNSLALTPGSGQGYPYLFSMGDIPAGGSGHFLVYFTLSCDAALGQTHCSTAHIFPDTLCSAPSAWNGGDIEVKGQCNGNEVIFKIKNKGGGVVDQLEYVVIEDIMIQMTGGPISLGPGEEQVVTMPANGSTWRVEADQALNHPFGQIVSDMVEDCGLNAGGGISQGIIPLYSTNDDSPFEDEDCRQNLGAFDPNDKQGFPLGVGVERRIPPGQAIEYLIRFQNTGTDTAFNIIILDTLPAELDLATIRMLGSSHHCIFKIQGENILQWQFKNIMLPDSNINEPASHGYVKFVIRPKAQLPNGTKIKNRAAIYFDFNIPVLTDYSLHTVHEKVLNISTVSFRPGLEVSVSPNPSEGPLTFWLKSPESLNGTLQVYDLRGRLVYTMPFRHNIFEADLGELPAGNYLFNLKQGETILASGKAVLTR